MQAALPGYFAPTVINMIDAKEASNTCENCRSYTNRSHAFCANLHTVGSGDAMKVSSHFSFKSILRRELTCAVFLVLHLWYLSQDLFFITVQENVMKCCMHLKCIIYILHVYNILQ